MSDTIKSYKDLMIWQRSIILVREIYELVNEFPADERYGIVQQIKRAAISVPSNIAEGAARNNSKEFRQFLGIALGSLAEIDTQLIIARDLSFIKDITRHEKIEKEIGEVRAMTLALVNKL